MVCLRLILGFALVFILSVIFSYFQGFIDFLIDLGIFPVAYKKNANFDIMVIILLYCFFMATAFFVVGIMYLFSWKLDWKLRRDFKKAKKQSIKKFGSEAPYFYLMDPNTPDIYQDKASYVHETFEAYLFEKYKDWKKVNDHAAKLSRIESLKLYHEAIQYLGRPDIPKEYGIFNAFTDEELAQFQK